MFKWFSFPLLLCSIQLVNAQFITNTKVLDCSKVEVWKNDTLTITAQNRDNSPAKLLPTYNPSVQLIGFNELALNSTVTYQVEAYLREKGEYEFKPTIYFRNLANSMIFTIRG